MVLPLQSYPTNITDTDDDKINSFYPENVDDLRNMNSEYCDQNDYEVSNVNFNADTHNILDILNEMRLGEPIQEDVFNEFYNNNYVEQHKRNIVDSTEDLSTYFDNAFNNNNMIEEMVNDNNPLDLLLCPEPCPTPDVQLEVIDSTVQFQYDTSEQFNYVPDMGLSYSDEPDSTVVISNFDRNNDNEMNFETTFNETEPYFECSTRLPMTLDEVEEDINKHFNIEQNINEASFYDCPDFMINDFNYSISRIENAVPHSSEIFPDNKGEQNNLVESLEPKNAMEPVNPTTVTHSEALQCNICSFKPKTKQGLSSHMRVHLTKDVKCKKCFGIMKTQYRRYNKKVKGKKYWCQNCDGDSHSTSKSKNRKRDKCSKRSSSSKS